MAGGQGTVRNKAGTDCEIKNSTFYQNEAYQWGGQSIAIATSTTCTLTNNIYQNSDNYPTYNHCRKDGTAVSGGHNIDNLNNSCFPTAGTGDIIETDESVIDLDPNLAYNGSLTTKTHAINFVTTTSPAYNNGDTTICTAVGNIDQRGRRRDLDTPAKCDSGAYEYEYDAPTTHLPIGGYDGLAANTIPAATQAPSSGDITITWQGTDAEDTNVILKNFAYSIDNGSTWITTLGDTSTALSLNWTDNNYTVTDALGTAPVNSFVFDTKHADVFALTPTLTNSTITNVKVRFSLNDGTNDSTSPVTSLAFEVDNSPPMPTCTYTSAVYTASIDTMIITGTDFTTMAAVDTEIKTYVDWSKFFWDIDSDSDPGDDITFAGTDVSSLIVTSDTALTLVFTSAKATAIEGTGNYGATNGNDALDISTGFSKDGDGFTATGDAVNNATITINTAAVGGYSADNVIPTAQVTQSTNGDGIITITWKGRDDQADNVILNTFEYSIDGVPNWNAPTNADTSAAFSTNWTDNDGAGTGYNTEATLAAAAEHSFTINTKHADLTGLAGVDQSDVQIRFKLNDSYVDSDYVASQTFQVDNVIPTSTITSAAYSAGSDTLTITGTNFTTMAAIDTNIETYVDWTKFFWDIDSDSVPPADITFAESDVTRLTVTSTTTLTLVFTSAKATAIEGTGNYGDLGGGDALDISNGFCKDYFGNTATGDAVANAPISFNIAPIGGYDVDNIIPAAKVTEDTGYTASGIITIRWKGRDVEADNVTLKTFEYSVDGGSSWAAPTNGDASTAFSTNWTDSDGANTGYNTETTLAAAAEHSFTFNTTSGDLTGLANVDQSDVQVRFYLNDKDKDSALPVTSGNFEVNNNRATALVVTKIADTNDGDCSLTDCSVREAIDAANDGNSDEYNIEIPADASSYEITLADYPAITKTMKLWGAGEGTTTIDGNNSYRMFAANADTLTITVEEMTLKNGKSATTLQGGAIEITDGNLVTKNCTFDGCTAANLGGSIFMGALTINNTFTISGSTFTSCSTTSWGGAIYSCSPTTITDSTFSTNSAQDIGGAIYTVAGSGMLLDIKGSTFSNNSTSSTGGAIFAGRNTDAADSYGLKITDSTFDNNTTLYMGGCIYAKETAAEISNSTFANNAVTTNSTTKTFWGGGAIFTHGIKLYNCTFSENSEGSTSGGGGAIYILSYSGGIADGFIKNCTFYKNTTPNDHGASIYTTVNTTLTNNLFYTDTATYYDNCIGAANLITGGHNFDNDTSNSCNLNTAGTDAINTDPSFSALAANGGVQGNGDNRLTHAISNGTLLGDYTVCTDADINSLDERGTDRTGGGTCFSGAFEYQPPIINVTKLSFVISDPVNGGDKPKRIPGAVIEYLISVNNSGEGSPDANTVVITDPIADTLSYYVDGGATFVDGDTTSNLAVGTVAYSDTASPGPYNYETYTPAPDADGYDDAITSLKYIPSGTFAFGGTPAASFALKFRAKIH